MLHALFPSWRPPAAPAAEQAKIQASSQDDVLKSPQPQCREDCAIPSGEAASATTPDFKTPPVAVIDTGRKTSRPSVLVRVGCSGGGTSSACSDTVSPFSEDGVRSSHTSLPASPPGSANRIAATNLNNVMNEQDKDPQRKVAQLNDSSLKNSRSSSASGGLGYEQMVRCQDAEDCATASYLRPIFDRLRYLGGDTGVVPPLACAARSMVTCSTENRDAEKDVDVLSFLPSCSSNQIKRDDGATILTFVAIASSFSILSGNQEDIALDISLMQLLRIIVESTVRTWDAESNDMNAEDGLSFPEFLHAYKAVVAAMQCMRRFPTHCHDRKARTRDRAQRMVQSFANVPNNIAIPVISVDPLENNRTVDGKESSSTSRVNVRVIALHMLVAVTAGSAGSTLWLNDQERKTHAPEANKSFGNITHAIGDTPSTIEVFVEENNSTEAGVFNEGGEADMVEVGSSIAPLHIESVRVHCNINETRDDGIYSRRKHERMHSYQHFALRRQVKDIKERRTNWMKKANDCRASLAAAQIPRVDEVTVARISTNNEKAPSASSTTVERKEASNLGPIWRRIISVLSGATATTLAFNIFAEGSMLMWNPFAVLLCIGLGVFAVGGS